MAGDARIAVDAGVAVDIVAAAGIGGGLIATSSQRAADPSSKNIRSATKTVDLNSYSKSSEREVNSLLLPDFGT